MKVKNGVGLGIVRRNYCVTVCRVLGAIMFVWMEKVKPVLREFKRMTVEKLRSFKGLENIAEEEAKLIIEQLEKFSVIAFELFHRNRKQSYGK